MSPGEDDVGLAEGWTSGWFDKQVRIWLGSHHSSAPDDAVHATCRRGHELVVNLGALYDAAMAGHRNFTLRLAR